MHQVSVSSDRFVVSRTARRPGDGSKYPTARLRDMVRIPPNQAALGVGRILPDFLRGSSGTNQDCGKTPAMRIEEQAARVVVIRKKTRWHTCRHRCFGGMGGSRRRAVTTDRRAATAYLTICSRIGPNRGTIRALRAPALDPLWKPKGAEQGGTLRGTEIDLLLRNQLHSWYRLSYPACSRFEGCFEKCGKVSLLLGSLLQESSEVGHLLPDAGCHWDTQHS